MADKLLAVHSSKPVSKH
jgi:hypothetical protein